MPTMCVLCAMRALLADAQPPVFDETPERHMSRAHPDPAVAQAERDEVQRRLAEKWKGGGDDEGNLPW